VDDRVLVFAQFDGLLTRVRDVLAARDIPALVLRGTAHQTSATLAKFQRETRDAGDERVLLLALHTESAAGANLTTANHCIFVHPLHVKKLHDYIAFETQAVGRVRRYGQTKNVTLHRFLIDDSIDTEIYDSRAAEIAKKTQTP